MNSYGNTFPFPGYTNANCVVGGSLCSLVENFSVTFTATVMGGTFNGDSIFSVFSPTTNKTGGFLGWEGLDPTGLSETVYDQHSGSTSTVNGGLADIFLGTPPPLLRCRPPSPLFATGLGAIGTARLAQEAEGADSGLNKQTHKQNLEGPPRRRPFSVWRADAGFCLSTLPAGNADLRSDSSNHISAQYSQPHERTPITIKPSMLHRL